MTEEETTKFNALLFSLFPSTAEPVKDLFDYITEKGILEENVAREFFRQIVKTILNCHKAGVVHRDIKVRKFDISLHSWHDVQYSFSGFYHHHIIIVIVIINHFFVNDWSMVKL